MKAKDTEPATGGGIDMGSRDEFGGVEIPAPAQRRISYPTICVSGETAKRFVDTFGEPEVGKEYEMTGATTCTSVHKSKERLSFDFELRQLASCLESGESGDEPEAKGEEDQIVKAARKLNKQDA